MKKIIYILMFFSTNINAQWLNIDNGGLYTYDNTVVTLDETSLNNNGEFDADDAGTLVLQSPADVLEIDGSAAITTHHILMDADCWINTDMIVNGDMTMQSGITDITNYNITLKGSIVNEREESRITASGSGEIIKIASLVSGETVNPGNIGLGFTPGENYNEVEIRRGHQPRAKESDEGINRYFSFGNTVLFNEISFNYFDGELNSLNEEELEIWGDKSGSWEQAGTSTKDFSANMFTVAVNDSYNQFSLFSEELQTGLIIPEGFSPNGDNVHDYFVIEGLEQYPNNSIIVFNRWGSVVYKSEPYNNDWDGTSDGKLRIGDKKLPVGTYFYILDLKDGSKPISGYVYINR